MSYCTDHSVAVLCLPSDEGSGLKCDGAAEKAAETSRLPSDEGSGYLVLEYK